MTLSAYSELTPVTPVTDDPAWQPPRDPLDGSDPRTKAGRILREIPQVSLQTGWTIGDVRLAIEQLMVGIFDQPAQLVDSIIADSRVESAFASRSGGLFGRPISFKLPPKYRKDPKAKKCLDAWQRAWPIMATEAVLSELARWGTTLGFGLAQNLWDTSGETWIPHPKIWHPRYTYWHWTLRRFVALTQDGQEAITPGDGSWIVHAPFGEERSWIRAGLRPIAPWWLARNYALRDWARYSERHGMPIIKAINPAGSSKEMVARFRNECAQLGQESVVALPQSDVAEIGSYDLQYLEASDQAWQAFAGLITQCNTEITLTLLGQNLTSEVKEGSFAAARVHADVRQAILEADARALAYTIYTQLARPFAAVNFGDAELAPWTVWDVRPEEDRQKVAQTFMQFAQGISMLKTAGVSIDNVDRFAKSMGIDIKTSAVDPLQVAAKKAGIKKQSNEERVNNGAEIGVVRGRPVGS